MTLSPKSRAWVELIRPPNLFTVPGDPLAGFFLVAASGASAPLWKAGMAALAALLLYIAGLIGNDVADLAEDTRDRPILPLPSGRVSKSAAVAASAGLALLALAVAATAGLRVALAAAAAQAAIMLYNGWLKRFAVAGSLCMGACRSLSLVLGAAAAGWQPGRFDLVAAAVIGLTLYIAGVTWIADRETVEVRIGPRRWIPATAFLFCLGWIAHQVRGEPPAFLLTAALATGWAVWQGARLHGVPPRHVLGPTIGRLIRGLLLFQAALCMLGGKPGLLVAAMLVLLWPVSTSVGRKFYAT